MNSCLSVWISSDFQISTMTFASGKNLTKNSPPNFSNSEGIAPTPETFFFFNFARVTLTSCKISCNVDGLIACSVHW